VDLTQLRGTQYINIRLGNLPAILSYLREFRNRFPQGDRCVEAEAVLHMPQRPRALSISQEENTITELPLAQIRFKVWISCLYAKEKRSHPLTGLAISILSSSARSGSKVNGSSSQGQPPLFTSSFICRSRLPFLNFIILCVPKFDPGRRLFSVPITLKSLASEFTLWKLRSVAIALIHLAWVV
jgi:hypothetical protein